ncbi:MAG: glycine/sarcosine/betaine reductase selenoprotein B family protein [Chloroflexota bacterium]|nr:glycine/sarcosine/betaine reductase selenoprotein B family protein [Chloroflexota bacterium]
MAMSKRCIPYTPRFREVDQSVFALVTTTGVHLRDQEPYVEDDNTWRLIPGDARTEQLMVTHDHYDHGDADEDINVVFPLDRLRELAAEGVIAGVSDVHLGFGFTQNLRDLYERAAPQMAKIIMHSQADGVILTGGCPLCHRVAVAIQREIEMVGIPTVLITVEPESSRQAGTPRAIYPEGFRQGHSLGGPRQVDLQRAVLRDALRRWEAREEPGHIWEMAY